MHNAPEDVWVSWLGWVHDLTSLVARYSKGISKTDSAIDDPLLIPILKNAGKDISHWFDEETGDVLLALV